MLVRYFFTRGGGLYVAGVGVLLLVVLLTLAYDVVR